MAEKLNDEELGIVWEQRRWYCCFGWHTPLLHERWHDTKGKAVKKPYRPCTRVYRRAIRGKSDAEPWSWRILVNELTDADGWQYGGCFGAVKSERLGGRAYIRCCDYVKKRQWVHADTAEVIEKSAKHGTLQLLNPRELGEYRQAAKKKYDQGVAELWDLLAHLDDSANFKSMAKALLDPVAMTTVAKQHAKAMNEKVQTVLNTHEPMHLTAKEWWHAPHQATSRQETTHHSNSSSSSSSSDASSSSGDGPHPIRFLHRVLDQTNDTINKVFDATGGRLGRALQRQVSKPKYQAAAATAVAAEQAEGQQDGRAAGNNAVANRFVAALKMSRHEKHGAAPEQARAPRQRKLVLSLPELECATGHALGIYGDLDLYVGGAIVQTYCGAIEKYTGVPEKDVLLTVWKSQPFEPAHYIAIDHKAKKIVISVRGTMEFVDTITDMVGRPVLHHFGPSLQGTCHHGILQAAQYVVSSAWDTLQQALHQQPGYPVLVTGHSLGGGTAALVALILKHDERLPESVRERLRAVALAPAAVTDSHLALVCQPFVASVVYGNDIVPRIDIYSVVKFVHEVANASPIQQALLYVYKAWASLWGGSKTKAGKSKKSGSKKPIGAIPEEDEGQQAAATDSQEDAVQPDAAAAGGGEVQEGPLHAAGVSADGDESEEAAEEQESALQTALGKLRALLHPSGKTESTKADDNSGTQQQLAEHAANHIEGALRRIRGLRARAMSMPRGSGHLEHAVAAALAAGSPPPGLGTTPSLSKPADMSSAGATAAAGELVHQSLSLARRSAPLSSCDSDRFSAALTGPAGGQAGTPAGHAAGARAGAPGAGFAVESFSREGMMKELRAAAATLGELLERQHGKGVSSSHTENSTAMHLPRPPTHSRQKHQQQGNGSGHVKHDAGSAMTASAVHAAPAAATQDQASAQAAEASATPRPPEVATTAAPHEEGNAATTSAPATNAPEGVTASQGPEDAPPQASASAPASAPDNSLFQQLLPPGVVYWLLRDQRATGLAARTNAALRKRTMSAIAAIQHMKSQVQQRHGLGAAGPPGKVQTRDVEMFGRRSAGDTGQPAGAVEVSIGSVEGAQQQQQQQQQQQGKGSAAAHQQMVNAFFGDVQDELGGQLHGEDEKEGSDEPSATQGEPVLLAVPPMEFHEMFFFKKALFDHMPLVYFNALTELCQQQRKLLQRHEQLQKMLRPWIKMGSLRRRGEQNGREVQGVVHAHAVAHAGQQ